MQIPPLGPPWAFGGRHSIFLDLEGSETVAKTKRASKSNSAGSVAGSRASSPGVLNGKGTARSGSTGNRWTFLSNHAHVLILLHQDPDLVLREVAHRVGITERAVQRIIQELEEEGFIERKRVGRRNHYRVLRTKPLRHPIESHRKIGDLLGLFGD